MPGIFAVLIAGQSEKRSEAGERCGQRSEPFRGLCRFVMEVCKRRSVAPEMRNEKGRRKKGWDPRVLKINN
jgi:hypothetical protein